MDLVDWVNHYWTVLAGIASFVFAVIYTKFESDDTKKDVDALEIKFTALELKFETHKDKISDAINDIQKDIREIMTILKREK